MKKVILVFFLGYCVIGINCSGKANSNYTANEREIKEAVIGNTDFAFDMYNELRNDPNAVAPEGNLFFSPYSISTALAMAYGGARGNTEKQMAAALNFTLPGPRLHSAFGVLQKQLVQDEKSRGYQLFLANALWGQKGEPVLQEFLDLNKQFYGTGFTLLDFINETEKSRKIINSWVGEKTKNKIKDLIPPNGIDEETRLVITNAIYFKGEWKKSFIKESTMRSEFYVTADETVEIDMMMLPEDKFMFYVDEEMQIIELPYKGDNLSMLVILPKKVEGLEEIENTLTTENLNNIMSKIQMEKVDVYLPKFKMTWGSFSLNNALIALGMPDAFEMDKADFSGINGKGGIWISNIFHKAFIEVNEEGTEAAAGTGVAIAIGGNSPPVFYADHPFIFIIKDNRSGGILFMGRLMNPAE